ncbi:hypothetical protein [Tautonia rosea]|uniref:hypothetical protein n=1 Tax=Tautonia rosea TaxID=2728037 RepID=UPI0014729DD3|nr:hypothetical protein [Tautonia rosea]
MYLPPAHLAFELVDPEEPNRPLDTADPLIDRSRILANDFLAFYSTRLRLPEAGASPRSLIVRFRCRFDRYGSQPIRVVREVPIDVNPREWTAGQWRPYRASSRTSGCFVTLPVVAPIQSFGGNSRIAIEGLSHFRPRNSYLQFLLVDEHSFSILDDQPGRDWISRVMSSSFGFASELTVPNGALISENSERMLIRGYVRRLIGGEITEDVLAPAVMLRR